MLKFDLEKYLGQGKETYGLRSKIEEVADKVSERGYSNVFFMGVGGTTAELAPVKEIMEIYSDLPVYLENAAELVLKGNKHLNKDSIVITASKSGDTKETVNCAKWCKEQGIEVISFVSKKDSPLSMNSTYNIISDTNGIENSYLKFFLLTLRLLYKRGDFPNYVKFADQMANLHTNLVKIKEKFEPRAAEIAAKYYNEPYMLWIGSGTLWGEAYLFSMCILEEMQWKRTKAVTSAEFFHGTLELVEKDLPAFLIKGEDACRPLDERAERFLRKYTDKLEVFDTKDYTLEGIDDEFRVIVSPMIITTILTGRLAVHLEANTKHSLDIRRYYRQFEY